MKHSKKKFKKNKKQSKELKLYRGHKYIRHHIVNRCKGGGNTLSNLLYFEENREKAWHFLFGNLSFEQVAELLIRVSRLKKQQTVAN